MNSDLYQIFSIYQVWPTKQIKIVHAGAHACVHPQHVKTCTQLLCLFCYFFVSFFFNFDLFPYSKWKKNEAALQIVMDKTQLFSFIHFFQFSKELLQNGQNVPKKGQNSKLFTFRGQNMTLRNKSIEIQKFGPEAHISPH